ncbi:low affinity immunoglobulin epsilon Fc receptor-like [Branchiostoma floridae x Branchiostoma belcheri]
MDVRAVLVMLAVLMPLLQASGQTVNINLNIGGSTGGRGTADKSQDADKVAELLKQGAELFPDTSQLETQLVDMTDTGQNMLITLLLEQNKMTLERDKEMQQQMQKMQEQIKDLTLDHCITKKTCCNKTLAACPSGYEWFCEKPDMCYKFSTKTGYKDYTDAKSACQADGGRLAMPKDKATNDFLAKLVKGRYTLSDAWIGLTDQVTKGTWVWEDGEKLGTDWNNWDTGDPTSNDDVINCAVLGSNSVWFHVSCGSAQNYICEAKATAAP